MICADWRTFGVVVSKLRLQDVEFSINQNSRICLVGAGNFD